jgi:hypothetical protein
MDYCNSLALNVDNQKVIINYSPQPALSIVNNGIYAQQSVNRNFLCMQIDKNLIWTKNTDKLIPELSSAC